MDRPRQPHVIRTWTVERIRTKAPVTLNKPPKRTGPVRKKRS
jgi:hypothetical protein